MKFNLNKFSKVRPPGHPIPGAARAGASKAGTSGREPAGIGDIVKGTTAKIGLKPCKGCERRAELLNRLFRKRGTRTTSL
jgi:hypothetical protein